MTLWEVREQLPEGTTVIGSDTPSSLGSPGMICCHIRRSQICIPMVENREMFLMIFPGWGGAQGSGLGTAVGGIDTKGDWSLSCFKGRLRKHMAPGALCSSKGLAPPQQARRLRKLSPRESSAHTQALRRSLDGLGAYRIWQGLVPEPRNGLNRQGSPLSNHCPPRDFGWTQDWALSYLKPKLSLN